MELSIYSTCKRISQKLLRNVKKFLDLIYTELDVNPFKIIRSNCEELMVLGPESAQDVRMVNSYPSKVMLRVVVVARERSGPSDRLLGLPQRQPLGKLVRVVCVHVEHLGHAVHGCKRAHDAYLEIIGVRVELLRLRRGAR